MQTATTQIATIPVLPEAQINAWLGMATTKNQLTAQLQQLELAAQAILLPVVGSEDFNVIDAVLAEYRKAHTLISDTRKPFTNTIDSAIVQPLMAFEKRVDPKVNTEYNTLVAKSLQLRKVEADKAAQANLKNNVIAQFKAHCINEFSRLQTELSNHLGREIIKQYEMHLTERISPELSALKSKLRAVVVPIINKFETTVLTVQELQAIYNEIEKPDFEEIYQGAEDMVDRTFANFDSDLANAAQAIAHQKEQAQLAEVEAASKLAEEQAINTLIVHSEAVVIDTPKIKKTVQIIVVESEQWAKAVMAAFITNLPNLAKYIRVKSWAKLSIGQMAEYLSKFATDEGVAFNGIELKEVEA
jgi:hypothetical protein